MLYLYHGDLLWITKNSNLQKFALQLTHKHNYKFTTEDTFVHILVFIMCSSTSPLSFLLMLCPNFLFYLCIQSIKTHWILCRKTSIFKCVSCRRCVQHNMPFDQRNNLCIFCTWIKCLQWFCSNTHTTLSMTQSTFYISVSDVFKYSM